MYELCTFLVTGSLATASARILRVRRTQRFHHGSGSGCAMTPWFLIRSSIASALTFWHQALPRSLQATAGVLDDGLEVGRQLCPGRLVDGEFARGRGLVPAGGVVIFRDLVQAELAVEIGADEFGGVDHAAFERRENVARRQQLRSTPSSLIDAAGETGNAHLETLEVLDLLDRLAEPAGHLHAGIAAQERHQIEFVVDLAPQFETAAVVHPAIETRRS